MTAAWLRQEHAVYAHVRAPFLAEMRAWDDDGERPLLVLEDLSEAVWSAPWTAARIAHVRETLAQVAATTPPPTLVSLESRRPSLSGWAHIAGVPDAFLSLRLCTKRWLSRSLGALTDAEAHAPLAGDDLVHLDVRRDNLCFTGERVLLVDWNWACRGNNAVDIAAWLPSLHAEGGPAPETILPDAPGLAAAISGSFASRAGRPAANTQERSVRAVQLAQLRVALPWAVRALGLRPLDGAAARM